MTYLALTAIKRKMTCWARIASLSEIRVVNFDVRFISSPPWLELRSLPSRDRIAGLTGQSFIFWCLMRLFPLSIIVISVLLIGCSIREEGPAEKFGRHLDDLSSDINEMTKDDARKERETERTRLDRERAERKSDSYENSSDYYRRPAPNAEVDSSANDRVGQKFDSRNDPTPVKPNDYRY